MSNENFTRGTEHQSWASNGPAAPDSRPAVESGEREFQEMRLLAKEILEYLEDTREQFYRTKKALERQFHQHAPENCTCPDCREAHAILRPAEPASQPAASKGAQERDIIAEAAFRCCERGKNLAETLSLVAEHWPTALAGEPKCPQCESLGAGQIQLASELNMAEARIKELEHAGGAVGSEAQAAVRAEVDIIEAATEIVLELNKMIAQRARFSQMSDYVLGRLATLAISPQSNDVPCPENERSATTAEESGIRSAGNAAAPETGGRVELRSLEELRAKALNFFQRHAPIVWNDRWTCHCGKWALGRKHNGVEQADKSRAEHLAEEFMSEYHPFERAALQQPAEVVY